MGYVLTQDVYVSNLFTQQKTELKFDSNEEFLLFLLNNTYTVSSIVKTLSPVFDTVINFPSKRVNRQPSQSNIKEILQTVYENECRKEEYRKEEFDKGEEYCKEEYSKEDYEREEYRKDHYDKGDFRKQDYRKGDYGKEPVQKDTYSKEDYRKSEYSSDQESVKYVEIKEKQDFPTTYKFGAIKKADIQHSESSGKSLIRKEQELICSRQELHEGSIRIPIPSRNIDDMHKGFIRSQRMSSVSEASPVYNRENREEKIIIRNATRSLSPERPSARNAYVYDPLILQKSTAALQEAEKVINQTKPELGLKRNKIVEKPRVAPLLESEQYSAQGSSRSECEPYKEPSTTQKVQSEDTSSSSSSSDASRSAPGSPQYQVSRASHEPSPTQPEPETQTKVEESASDSQQWTEQHRTARETPSEPYYPPSQETDNQNSENQDKNNDLSSQDKMYICPICNKEFKGSGRVRNCKIHVNTVHLKHKPYKCNFCNVRFGYKDYMKRHLIRHHKSVFYSYGAESALEKYTTYETEAVEPTEDKY